MRIGRPRWFGLLLWAGLLATSGCTGCHQDAWIPEQPGPQGPTTQDLLEFQRLRVLALDSLIHAVTADWTKAIHTGTGVRYERLDSVPGAPAVAALPEGSVLEIHHRFSLLDGRVIADWTSDGPLAFEPGNTDLPSGFHELFGQAHLGDSLRAILPPIRAWGMSGLPPDIPQEAIIAVQCRVELYRRPA